MKKILRYISIILLVTVTIALTSTTIMKYYVSPEEVYVLQSENLIEDGSFESFNQPAGDCCKTDANKSSVFASKSTDAFDGEYSLNLTSNFQCACINKLINNFEKTNKYLLSFYYKGDNPRYCNWVVDDNKCLPEEKFWETDKWTHYRHILSFNDKSRLSNVHFYSDSRGETVTNLYDDLQVHRLMPVAKDYPFDYEEEYVIKTNPENIVYNEGAEKLNEEGYYFVIGAPKITLKFPWVELVLIMLMMLIVIRLLFKKQVRDFTYELRGDLKKITKQKDDKFLEGV